MRANRKEPETISFPNVRALDVDPRRGVLAAIDGEERWIPQNVIHDDSEVWRKGDEGVLVLQEWWVAETWLGDEDEEDDESD